MSGENFIVHRISSRYLVELNQFCEGDKDIENCRQKLEQEIFRHDWFVAWFDKEGAPFYKLPLFNKPFFKDALRRFYTKAHDFISRFGFVGYYHVKDMDAWMLQVAKPKRAREIIINEQDEEEEENEEDYYYYNLENESPIEVERQLRDNITAFFPFGVIPIGVSDSGSYGHYTVVENRNTMQNTIVFQPDDENLSLYYDFTVIDHGARFRANFGQDLVPISSFEELRRQKRLVLEGETSLFDANSMIIYPESIAYVKPMKDAAIEDVADDTLYSLNNILCAKQKNNYERQDMAMDDARFQVQRNAMKRTIRGNGACSGGGYTETPSTKIWDEKMRNDRPSSYEAMRYLPGPVEIMGSKPGAPVVNVAERERKYENDVCTVMRLPYVFFKPHGMMNEVSSLKRTGSSSGSTGHNDMYQKLLETEVKRQHQLFGDIFKEIYYHTFSRLDNQIFSGAAQPTVYEGLEAGIRFDHTVEKTDEAIRALLEYYKIGIIPGEVLRHMVFKNYNIPLSEIDYPIVEPLLKKRKIEPLLDA